MHDDVATPSDDSPEQDAPASIDLVSVPDDPDDPRQIQLQRADADVKDLATEWITVDVDDVVDVEAYR